MKKELIALGAALALVGTLTACSSTPADQNKGSAGSGATGSTTGRAAGTAYPLRDERDRRRPWLHL